MALRTVVCPKKDILLIYAQTEIHNQIGPKAGSMLAKICDYSSGTDVFLYTLHKNKMISMIVPCYTSDPEHSRQLADQTSVSS